MRSLTTKLTLAFLAISIISIGVIVELTHLATNREFNNFVNNRYRTELASELAQYYETNGNWEEIETNFISNPGEAFHPTDDHTSFFAVADANGVIVLENFKYKKGRVLDSTILDNATPIKMDDSTVGYLIIEQPPPRPDPALDDFRRRLDFSLVLSGLGTIILALLFGLLLSRSITRPIRELTQATHSMADGKLGQQVSVRSRDEIGELATSFNKMSADLARSLNLRKQMTADIAHELRTPLSLILGHAEGVHDGVLQPTHQNFEIIREEAERLEHLVNDLRTLSLADAGELSVDFQAIDVNELMHDVQVHYLTLFNQHRVTLDFQPAPVILKANLDPSRFAQVLNNILDNALRYTPEGGRVALSVSEVNGKIQLAVRDSGEGVTSEEASHLFDRFYRVDESRTREEGGSGLGLAIAKSIVEMHKGRIWAESEKGKGLAIFIQLPKI